METALGMAENSPFHPRAVSAENPSRHSSSPRNQRAGAWGDATGNCLAKAQGGFDKPTLLRMVTCSQPIAGAMSRTGPLKILSVTSTVSPPGAKVMACLAFGPLVKRLPRTVTFP